MRYDVGYQCLPLFTVEEETFEPLISRKENQEYDEIRNFDNLVLFSKDAPFAEVVNITPKLANHILSKNPSNRAKKTALVSTIRGMITSGRWTLNGETIIISSEGELNDGQNRLNAIADSGIACEALVAFGFTRESRMSVDSNQASRSTSDFLKMQGIGSATEVARIGSVLLVLERFGHYPPSLAAIPVQEVQSFCLEHLEEVQSAMAVVSPSSGRLLLNQQAVAALHILFARRAGDEVARQFTSGLISGQGMDGTNPIYVLRERLIREKATSPATRHQINCMMELIVRGWNHFRSGTCPSKYLIMGTWPEEISR